MVDTFSLIPFSVSAFFILLLGGVYMTLGRLSRRREFTPIPSRGYVNTTKCHAGASHPGVSSLRLLNRGENFTPVRNFATVNAKRPIVSVWNRSAGRLERVAHA